MRQRVCHHALPAETPVRRDRIISLVIAVVCMGTYHALVLLRPSANPRKGGMEFLVPLIFLFPLALICFGDELGNYTGPVSRGYITRKSPGCLVKFMGWVFLLAIAGLLLFGVIAGDRVK